jgi:glutaconyl-CoA/methylmalonyl-CoA decarboxylase subunit gamma
MGGGGSLKLVVVLDGERREVEVDLARQIVRVGPHEWPIQVGSSGNGVVAFEILGERVEVRTEGTPEGKPPSSLIVNGELHSLTVESSVGTATRPAGPATAGGPHIPSVPAEAEASEGPGRAVLPPMPGKVLEVRVRNGDKVQPGQVLLVVEAMKMRNEVASPMAGEVSGLHVAPGANVTAREVLLRILTP